MVKALAPHYDIKFFSEQDVSPEFFYDVDCVAFPGGIGDSQRYHDFFNRRRGNVIADFVARGGHYLGICMGAYWAGSHYFDILEDCDAVQYIKRPKTDIRRSYGTYAPVTWQGDLHNMYFYDGCAIVGNTKKSKVIATYSNGDPMAIIQNRIGIIGCHPESQEFWYKKSYLKPFWHHGEHHRLLLNFVDQLIGQKITLQTVSKVV
jgi:glutamine amidotransferase-like uncharacterized protein